jgi:hypothetical protein
MAPNHSESRGISLVLGFQSWLKSESLGLNGTHSDMHNIQRVKMDRCANMINYFLVITEWQTKSEMFV